jgi:hypothetical protein
MGQLTVRNAARTDIAAVSVCTILFGEDGNLLVGLETAIEQLRGRRTRAPITRCVGKRVSELPVLKSDEANAEVQRLY